jgi:hypothetical protein
MSDLIDQLTTAQTAIGDALTDAENQAPTAADSVLSALVTALEAAGYTVTAPTVPELPATTDPETP